MLPLIDIFTVDYYRLGVLLLLSVGVYFAAYFMPSCLATVLVSALFGYLLSIDLGGLVNQIIHTCRSRNKVSDDQGVIAMDMRIKGFLWRWGVLEFLYHFIMLAVVGVTAGLLNVNSHTISGDVWRILGYVIIGFCVVEKILRDLQNVYIFFGLLRNWLFPKSSHLGKIFLDRRKMLKPLGVVRRIIVNWGKVQSLVLRCGVIIHVYQLFKHQIWEILLCISIDYQVIKVIFLLNTWVSLSNELLYKN